MSWSESPEDRGGQPRGLQGIDSAKHRPEARNAPFLRGTLTELRPLWKNTLAIFNWSDGTTGKALTRNLSCVTQRGISDEHGRKGDDGRKGDIAHY